MKNTETIRKWLNTSLLSVCAVALVVIAILVSKLPSLPTGEGVSYNKPSQNNSALVIDLMTVETSYGSVKFPADFKNYLDYKENKSGNVTECIFSCNIDGKNIELYKIVFGNEEDENPAGYLERDNARVPVSVVSNEIPIDNLSEDNLDIVQAMSGTYSDIMVSITEWDGFTYE